MVKKIFSICPVGVNNKIQLNTDFMKKILKYNKQFINYDLSQEMLILTITKCISINCLLLKLRVIINRDYRISSKVPLILLYFNYFK